MWHHNLTRLDELDNETIERAAHALLRLQSIRVMKAAVFVWSFVLAMIFTFILTIRFAAYLPLPF